MRKEIEKNLGIEAFDIFGLTEMIGPGVSCECEAHSGLHVNEDHFIPEIINPDTGLPVPDGTPGELVFSSVTKQGMPLIRYRTRDICTLNHEVCSCGRTLVRMSKPAGRTDDMLIIRGVNVFPSQIEAVLLDIGETSPYYMIYVDRVGALDTMDIEVELREGYSFDQVRRLQDLEKRIKSAVESILGIAANIRLVPMGSLPRSEGKAKHVIDKRTLVD
jgi:phenylacetate-CoA ligase